MSELAFAPVDRKTCRRFVHDHHSHHRAHVCDIFRLGAFVCGTLVAVAVAEQPKAQALVDGLTWEISRLCVGPGAPRYTAGRLLARMGRIMDAAGVTLGVSYTRVDERGSCYLAAGWAPVALVKGRAHDTGNRSLRWLPGLYEPSSEIIDRVRWEHGPRAAYLDEVRWDGARWIPCVPNSKAVGHE